jgi:hypothetical protein
MIIGLITIAWSRPKTHTPVATVLFLLPAEVARVPERTFAGFLDPNTVGTRLEESGE